MSLPDLEQLSRKVQNAEQQLSQAKRFYSENSQEYRQALKQLAVNWFVLKQSREPEEFLEEIL